MNKYLAGVGLALASLSIFYFISKSRDEEVSPFLTYGPGIAAAILITFLLYNLMRRFKKK